ncbi:calcium-binding protein [Actinoplanes sp. NPDC024001]|uniref:calcium-binding protein n=1 Tax=Actinoplanes sp. NPDC024001 TaxID=3154598 RepID=UPI00340F11F9
MSRSTWLTRIGVTLLTTAAVGVASAPAALGASTGVVSVSGKTVVKYKAATGKQNKVVITRSGKTVTIDDKVAIRAGKGCTKVSGDKTRIRCKLKYPPTQVQVYTYDRADSVTNKTSVPMYADGGSADDVLTGGSSADRLNGHTGADRLYGNGGNDYFIGGSGNDRLSGSSGADALFAGSGNDVVYAGSGDDYVWGDTGHDVLYGLTGRDNIFGNQGADWLDGGDGNDRLTGDVYSTGISADVLVGGSGTDVADYSSYRAPLLLELASGLDHRDDGVSGEGDAIDVDVENALGGSADDLIYGGRLSNEIHGNGGNDRIHGEGGNDRLNGSTGKDSVFGDDGDDVLTGVDDPDHADFLDGGFNGAFGDQCLAGAADTVRDCER